MFMVGRAHVCFGATSIDLCTVTRDIQGRPPIHHTPYHNHPFIPSNKSRQQINTSTTSSHTSHTSLPRAKARHKIRHYRHSHHRHSQLPTKCKQYTISQTIVTHPTHNTYHLSLRRRQSPKLRRHIIRRIIPPQQQRNRPLLNLSTPRQITTTNHKKSFHTRTNLYQTFHLTLLFREPPLPRNQLTNFRFHNVSCPTIYRCRLYPTCTRTCPTQPSHQGYNLPSIHTTRINLHNTRCKTTPTIHLQSLIRHAKIPTAISRRTTNQNGPLFNHVCN